MDPMKDEHTPYEDDYFSASRQPWQWEPPAPEHRDGQDLFPSAPTPGLAPNSNSTPGLAPNSNSTPGPGPNSAPPSGPAPAPAVAPALAPDPAAGSAPAPSRRGPGWGGVTGLVALGMLLSSGATLGGVVAYDQLVESDPAPTVQEAPASSTEARPAAVTSGEDVDWAAIADQVGPSAVAIQVSTGSGTSQGTGVILDEQGAILTNNHVVGGAQGVEVTMSDGLSYPASVVGTDATTDLAVIRLDSPPKDLQPATFADSTTVEVGQPVMALGTPLGLQNTVTTGIISALDRPVTASGEEADGSDTTYSSAIQTDAAINPGNSGGPLVDAAGQVIGINTAIAGIPNASGQAGSIGLGFAIPSNTAAMIAEQLQEDGTAEHAFLGVTSKDGSSSDGGATHRGADVVSIEPQSPAAEADLQEGDLLIGVDDIPVGGAAALTGVVRGLEIGTTHQFEVVRDGAVQTIDVTLGVRPS
ncbi:trypsin-like peptidase domain-containing protein [Brachybacterium paraconglomeratum]|uniref:S1C family serine protease n=1 Tax=Brachybacterium paraconglomeratum TaxID=173362 RepID=UPI0031E9BEC9